MSKFKLILYYFFLYLLTSSVICQENNFVEKNGGICFRVDDNQPITWYQEYAKKFNKYNLKFSFALNLGNELNQNYINGVRELISNGHEMMDHTPNHMTNYFVTKFNSENYKNIPGVDHIINENKICLKHEEVDISESSYSGMGIVSDKKLISYDNGAFRNLKDIQRYIYFSELDQLVWINIFQNKVSSDPDTLIFKDVWYNQNHLGNHSKERFYIFDFENVHLTIDAYKLLAEESIKLAELYGLKRATTWIQPGGYFPRAHREEIMQSMAEIGYSSASVYPYASLKVFNEYDPENDKRYGMGWGNFNISSTHVSWLKSKIADNVAKNKILIGTSHFNNFLNNDWNAYLNRVDEILEWCVDTGIPVRTYNEWADILYSKTPNPNQNIFPNLSIDRDENSVPDGYGKQLSNFEGDWDRNDGVVSSSNHSITKIGLGTICFVEGLGGIEKGENYFEIWTKGEPGNIIEVEFNIGNSTSIFSFPAESSDWEKQTLNSSINGNNNLYIPDNISLIDIKISCSKYKSGKVKISGMQLYKSSGFLNTFVVSPSNRSVGSSAGSTSFTITSNINWNVSCNANWLSLSRSSGSNNGTFGASFDVNTSSNSRTANITASGGGINRTVTVTQAGTSGSGGGGTGFTVSPTSKSVEKTVGSFILSITTNGSWRVRDNTNWMKKTPKTGSGNGTSKIEFEANATGSPRTGIISVTVGSEVKQIMVTQSSSGTTSTSLAVSPANSNVGSSSGSASFSVTSNVSWNATDNAGWLTLSPSSGSNNGTITASYSANTNSSSRTAIITTSGGGMSKTVTLTQAGTSGSGGGGSFTVSPSSKSVGNGAGYFNLAITTSGSWRVRDNTNWMRKVPKTGTGNGTSRIEFSANTTGAPRKGIVSVTVGNEVKEIVVTQGDNGSSGGSFTVSPSSKSVGNGAGYFNLSITTSGNWRVRDNTNWMKKIPKTGSGNGTTRIEYMANYSVQPRTGIISVTVGNEVKEVVVTQGGTSQSIASVELSKESAGFRSEKAEEIEVIPTEYGLDQNYPNPFNPTTTITYSMPIEGHAEIVVYNSIGEVVKSLVSEFRSAGTHRITFDASNLSSGIYFYKFKSGKFTDNKKMILLK